MKPEVPRWSSEPPQARWRPWRLGIDVLSLALLAPPWLLCAWLGELIASGRWSSVGYAMSLTTTAAAALLGWRTSWRLVVRWSDFTVAQFLLTQVEPAEPWSLFVEPEQAMRAEHLTHCLRRWGVSPRSSGWRLLQTAWRADTSLVLSCAAIALHPWWLLTR